jgi:hypothetical protein
MVSQIGERIALCSVPWKGGTPQTVEDADALLCAARAAGLSVQQSGLLEALSYSLRPLWILKRQPAEMVVEGIVWIDVL